MSDLIEFNDKPEIHTGRNTFGYEWAYNNEPCLRVQVQDMRQEGDNIFADFTVWWLYEQPLGVLPVQPMTTLKVNSSHYTGWRNIPKALGERLANVDIEGAMTFVINDVLDRFLNGDNAVRMGDGDGADEAPFILKPWIANSGSTVMYGEGGLSKSLIALAMSVSVSTGVPIFGMEPTVVGPVMYFDYEDDASAHERRLHALCHAFGIPLDKVDIHHKALVSKVTTSKRMMTKEVERVGAVLGILDSVGMGRGGSAIAAEDTIRMFRALREVGVPFLAIDHVSKEAKAKKGAEVDAYGSIYTMNSARLAWSLTRQLDGKGDSILIHARNTKANHVRTAPPQTIAITYDNDERGVPQRIDIETGNEFGMLMPTVGTHQRMMMWLQHGEWRTYAQVAEELGITKAALKMAVGRDQETDRPTFERKTEGRQGYVRLRSNTPPVTDGVTDESEGVDDDETQ